MNEMSLEIVAVLKGFDSCCLENV